MVKKKKWTMSPEHRRKVSEAVKARHARQKLERASTPIEVWTLEKHNKVETIIFNWLETLGGKQIDEITFGEISDLTNKIEGNIVAKQI